MKEPGFTVLKKNLEWFSLGREPDDAGGTTGKRKACVSDVN
jgi:hypothetical protein